MGLYEVPRECRNDNTRLKTMCLLPFSPEVTETGWGPSPTAHRNDPRVMCPQPMTWGEDTAHALQPSQPCEAVPSRRALPGRGFPETPLFASVPAKPSAHWPCCRLSLWALGPRANPAEPAPPAAVDRLSWVPVISAGTLTPLYFPKRKTTMGL